MKPGDTSPTAFVYILAEYMKVQGVSGPDELATLVREKTGYPLSEEVLVEHMCGKQALKDPTLAHRLAEVLGLEPTQQARLGAAYLFGLDISQASANAGGGSGYDKEK